MDLIKLCMLGPDKRSFLVKEELIIDRWSSDHSRQWENDGKTRLIYKCADCGQQYGNRKYNMHRHLERCFQRVAEQKNQVKHACPLCPDSTPKWTRLNYLEIHMESVHNIREHRRKWELPTEENKTALPIRRPTQHSLSHWDCMNFGPIKTPTPKARFEIRQRLRPTKCQPISVIKSNPFYKRITPIGDVIIID